MPKKLFTTALVLAVLTGCTFPVHTTKIDSPIIKPVFTPQINESFHSIMSIDNKEHITSIGDDLFVVSRYIEIIETYEVIEHKSPTKLKFPDNEKWTANYAYNDGNSGELYVYTTPAYHQAQIGVILDSNLVVSTDKPLVQVTGLKEGRRWTLNDKSRFFKIKDKSTKNYIEKSWGLRFGGFDSGYYIFEIVNRSESTVSEILQTIKITRKDFLSGFVVRNIFIKGTKQYESGVIKFKAHELQNL